MLSSNLWVLQITWYVRVHANPAKELLDLLHSWLERLLFGDEDWNPQVKARLDEEARGLDQTVIVRHDRTEGLLDVAHQEGRARWIGEACL